MLGLAPLSAAIVAAVLTVVGAADDGVGASVRTAQAGLASGAEVAGPALQAAAVQAAGLALVLVVVFPYAIVLAIPLVGALLLASTWMRLRRPRS